jgi:hypothetical protein
MDHGGGIGKLSTALGPGKTKGAEIHEQWATYDRIFEQLEKQGFKMPGQPDFPPPEIAASDLLTEDNTHFTTMYAQILSWHNYAKTAYALVRANLLQIENEMEFIAATTRKECKEFNKTVKKGEGYSSTDIEDEITVNAVHKKLKIEAQKWEQKKLILDSIVDNLERTMRVISRQVEINRQEIEGEHIKNNMGGRGHQPPRGFSR